MRIAELSQRSGVSVPTIKYYLREGLLPAGARSSPNQASYGAEHLRRLRLIRALIEVGGLPVAAVGAVLEAVDEPDLPMYKLLGVVSDSLYKPEIPTDDNDEWLRARAEVEQLLVQRGWSVPECGPAVETLSAVVVKLAELGYAAWSSEMLGHYLEAAERIAEFDVGYVLRFAEREAVVDGVVVLTVLGETAFAIARRMAHQQVSARMLGVEPNDR